MDNLRFILIFTLVFTIYTLWDTWQSDYGPKIDPIPITQPNTDPDNFKSDIPPDSTDPTEIISSQEIIKEPVLEPTTKAILSVTTDVIRIEIDSSGTLVKLDLLNYPVSEDQLDQPLKLFNDTDTDWFIAQSGFRAARGTAPNHHSSFQFDSEQYQLNPGEDSLRVPLYWDNEDGIQVTKTFIFSRGSYLIELEQEISNRSDRVWSGGQYAQLQRNEPEDDSSTFIRTYTGGVIYSEEEKYEKVDFDDILDANLSRDVIGGWSAMIQHYFATAWIPPDAEKNHYYTIALPEYRYVIGSYSPQFEVLPGEKKVFKSRLYSGPKIQKDMEKVTTGLELTVDYGALTFIGKPIFWLLQKFHGYVGNWGFAIMLVTLVIKALFFKLSEASYKSMARMRALQPKLQALKERYEDDKQRFNQEMMALYRTEKVNPLGGCFPILVQIPVFISLYWVLIETVELRLAPFMLWITDLSSRDPFFVLPLLMGLTMWIQQQLNPTPVDPVQEKIMKLFPVIFTVFFMFFPAGLVLYWVVNNTLSIMQQWYITRQIEQAAAAKA